MKKTFTKVSKIIAGAIILAALMVSCNKKGSDIQYTVGTFPDTTYALEGLNSQWDDYNSNLPTLGGGGVILFSSNRSTSGGTFDITLGGFQFNFVQTNGDFFILSDAATDPFYDYVRDAVNTSNNEFGPFWIFSSSDGYDFFFVATESTSGDLDLRYIRHLPYFGGQLPLITGPNDVTVINSTADDAYISFDFPITRAYFSTNASGNSEISYVTRPSGVLIDTWLSSPKATAVVVDSLSSPYEDRCPYISKSYMVFTSDRPGGYGGFDLYYSVFKDGKWSAPINFGDKINSPSDEYRPIIGSHPDFTNNFMIFSSNRPGGKGGFDLYMSGITLP